MIPAELLLGLVLTGTQSHYENRGLIDDKRLEHLLLAGKQILYKSHQESDVRQALGFSPKVWQSLTDVLTRAIPVLEQQSFSWKNPSATNFNGSSSDLIAARYLQLVKDIERLNDLCTIARNLLATTKKAQNLAAEKNFDQQILKLIDICVKVTARGFDGETNARNEERWQKVVNLYKRLLITCLQFLHNFIMHNEHRKLVLWLDLFGNSQEVESEAQPSGDTNSEYETVRVVREARFMTSTEKVPEGEKFTPASSLGYNIDDVHALFDLMNTNKSPDDHTQEAAKLLMEKIRCDMERLSGLSASELDNNPEALLKVGAALRAQLPAKDSHEKTAPASIEQTAQKAVVNINRMRITPQEKPTDWSNLPDLNSYAGISAANQEITDDDLSMPRTSQSAAETLQEAKDELMARLQEIAPLPDEKRDPMYGDEEEKPAGTGATEDDPIVLDSAEDSMDEEDEDDESCRSLGDQERGLLTDVPLVLGPTEIEALPMIIQAGIVDNFGMKNGDRQGAKNMQAVRCHILLAQESGRNVLRELLIFIAAWDLPDDEFYFKMMVQIMEAILKNGLMSHAYSDFGQAKDIISPAQAVVIKILTHIFRSKYSPASVQNSNDPTPPKSRVPSSLSRVDVLTVRYIFTVFRGNIIPETCALIYLQGQIRSGLAFAEDFPLNLWDMERVYEGVYQFLEFFAVLTENYDWKRLLVEWEIVYDLVTLIKELDLSIPKASLIQSMPPPAQPNGTNGATTNSEQHTSRTPSPITVAVERPYDPTIDASTTTFDASPPTNGAHIPPSTLAPTTTSPSTVPPQTAPTTTEDPSSFEWRNLKKLIVLVLSSLVWKSPAVQSQIRLHGGVDTILSCTQHDQNNPYIKEHAVMCLKFLLEGNVENQELVGGLEAREVARDPEGLPGGVEVGLDARGRVKVVRNGIGMGRGGVGRRASEGNANGMLGMRERFGKLDVNGHGMGRESGRIMGEELDNL